MKMLIATAYAAAILALVPVLNSATSAQDACTIQCKGRVGGCEANPPSVQRCYNKCKGVEVCPQPKAQKKSARG